MGKKTTLSSNASRDVEGVAQVDASPIPFMLAHVAFGVVYFTTAQTILLADVVSPTLMPLTGLLYVSDFLSSSFTSTPRRTNANANAKKTTPAVAYALPILDMGGLTCAFESMKLCGGATYQTISGLLIPLSAILSRVVLRRTFVRAQHVALGCVICGLVVKGLGARGGDANAVDAVGVMYGVVATVFYAWRGVVMEYLSTSEAKMSGNAMTMLMGSVGLGTFVAYASARLASDANGLVWEHWNKRERDVQGVVFVIAVNMISRAFMVKMMMAIVERAGSTQLALSNAIRSVGVIAFSHVIFCANDERQCLNAPGALSAFMVVLGGVAFALNAPAKAVVVKTAASKDSSMKSKAVAAARESETELADVSTVRRRRSARKS